MRTQMWINGQFTGAASGRTIDVHDPATEEVIERVPAGDAADVDAAVSAASAAFPAWRSLGAGRARRAAARGGAQADRAAPRRWPNC